MQPTVLALLALAHAGTVSINIHQDRSPTPRGRGDRLIQAAYDARLAKRDVKDVPESLANGFYSYAASLYIGSDKQLVTPSVDTGSSDLWVMTSSNPYCSADPSNCQQQTFDPATSTSFKNLSKPWDIQYLDTTGAFGWLGQDDVNFDGKNLVHNAQFAVANVANSTQDVFGIGFTGNEASVEYFRNETIGGYTYPNLPVAMKDQGLIERIAYSLFLNGINARDGQVLFGGVDHAKYEGTLSLVPMVNIYRTIKTIIDFRIMLNGISLKTGNNSCSLVDFALPFLLDSGTSYALMPQAIIDQMAKAMNYTQVNGEFYQGNCNGPFEFDSFELNFSGVKLQAPPSTLLDYSTDNNNNVITVNGEKQCILAISNEDSISNYILGDIFLRNLYVVYDLEGLQIGIAQAKFDNENSNVEEIVTGIPSATSAPSYASTSINRRLTPGNYSQCLTVPVKTSAVATSVATPSSNATTAAASSTATPLATPLSNGTSSTAIPVDSQLTSAASSTIAGNSTLITIPTPTTFSTNGQTYTVTDSTVLTITDCGCTETGKDSAANATPSGAAATPSGSPATPTATSALESRSHTDGFVKPSNAVHGFTVTVQVVHELTTSCSEPTVISTNGGTYTVTEATMLTITDCPCTVTHTHPVYGASPAAPVPKIQASEGITTNGIEVATTPVAPPSSAASTVGNSEAPVASNSIGAEAPASPTSASSQAPVRGTPVVTTSGTPTTSVVGPNGNEQATGSLSSGNTIAAASPSGPSLAPASSAPALANAAARLSARYSIILGAVMYLL